MVIKYSKEKHFETSQKNVKRVITMTRIFYIIEKFTRSENLPTNWNFFDLGGFSIGCLKMGIEIIREKGNDIQRTYFL
jgi:hypothetical protein